MTCLYECNSVTLHTLALVQIDNEKGIVSIARVWFLSWLMNRDSCCNSPLTSLKERASFSSPSMLSVYERVCYSTRLHPEHTSHCARQLCAFCIALLTSLVRYTRPEILPLVSISTKDPTFCKVIGTCSTSMIQTRTVSTLWIAGALMLRGPKRNLAHISQWID